MINKDNIRLFVTISKDRLEFMESLCKIYGISKSALVNNALTEYFQSHKDIVLDPDNRKYF